MEVFLENIAKNATSLYITLFIIILTIIYYVHNNRSLPPGPKGVPFLGYYPFLTSSSPHILLHELGKKYGDVFSFRITGQLYINLGSHKAIREAMVTKTNYFNQRPLHFTVANMFLTEGIIFLNGEKWTVIRKFFNQQFRESGMNTLKIEGDNVCDAIAGTIDDLYKSKGEPVELVSMLTDKCTRILYRSVFGERGTNMEEIMEINKAMGNIFGNLGGSKFLISGNIARFLILPLLPGYWRAMKGYKIMSQKLYAIIDRHHETFDESNIRNLIDAYLYEKKVRSLKKDPSAGYFTDRALMSTLVEIVGDGVVSVSIAISSAIKALLDHPEEQEKIYKELIEVIGPDRDPSLDDKRNLTYTNAFITEVLRMTDVFPFFPDMKCSQETTLSGYRIPKGAITVMNIWSSHYNPKEYEEPEKFNPSRFMPAEGKKKVEQPILFGLGKRACLGEGYTMSQIFLFLTTIVKHFKLSKPKDGKEEGLLFLAGTMTACAVPRRN